MAVLFRLEIAYVCDKNGVERFFNRDLYRLEMGILQGENQETQLTIRTHGRGAASAEKRDNRAEPGLQLMELSLLGLGLCRLLRLRPGGLRLLHHLLGAGGGVGTGSGFEFAVKLELGLSFLGATERTIGLA